MTHSYNLFSLVIIHMHVCQIHLLAMVKWNQQNARQTESITFAIINNKRQNRSRQNDNRQTIYMQNKTRQSSSNKAKNSQKQNCAKTQNGYRQVIVAFSPQDKEEKNGGLEWEVAHFYWLRRNPTMHVYGLSLNLWSGVFFSNSSPRIMAKVRLVYSMKLQSFVIFLPCSTSCFVFIPFIRLEKLIIVTYLQIQVYIPNLSYIYISICLRLD